MLDKYGLENRTASIGETRSFLEDLSANTAYQTTTNKSNVDIKDGLEQ